MPEPWSRQRLGDLVDLLIGPPFKSSVFRGATHGTRLLRGMNLAAGSTRWDETYLWPNEELQPFAKFLLAEGDLCIAMDATFTGSGSIRAAVIGRQDLPCLLVQRVARLRLADPMLRDLLWLHLTSRAFASHLTDRQTGAFAPHISGKDIASYEIQSPPRKEQRRIVDLVGALDQLLDGLEAEKRALLSLLAALRMTLIETVAWQPLVSMTEPGGVQIGPFGSQLHAHEYVEDGVPVVMPQDIIDGEIRTDKIKRVSEETAARLKRHQLRPGDLVLPRRGDLTKRALVTAPQEGWICGTGSIRIRLADPGLAPALLEGLSTPTTDEWLITNAVGTTMPNLNTEIVSKIPAPVFTHESWGVADSCVVSRGEYKALVHESHVLAALRSCLLGDLLSAEVTLPDSYDALLGPAV